MKKRIIITITIALLAIGIIIGAVVYFSTEKKTKFQKTDYESLDLKNYDKLMVVAHPDDDMLWGGSRLIKDDYVVVCVTCGAVKKRVTEFENVMKATNDIPVMLGYPDKTNNERDSWDDHRENIKKDLEKIYNLKDWKEIVTHNPDGEYGHQHHKMTSNLVTSVVPKDKLTYFGKYYSKKNIVKVEKLPEQLDKDILDKKKEILHLYVSQEFIHTTFSQMIPYEDWKTYDKWQELYEKDK